MASLDYVVKNFGAVKITPGNVEGRGTNLRNLFGAKFNRLMTRLFQLTNFLFIVFNISFPYSTKNDITVFILISPKKHPLRKIILVPIPLLPNQGSVDVLSFLENFQGSAMLSRLLHWLLS